MTMRRRHRPALEVDAVAADEPGRLRVELERVLEEHATAGGRRRLADELPAEKARAPPARRDGATG